MYQGQKTHIRKIMVCWPCRRRRQVPKTTLFLKMCGLCQASNKTLCQQTTSGSLWTYVPPFMSLVGLHWSPSRQPKAGLCPDKEQKRQGRCGRRGPQGIKGLPRATVTCCICDTHTVLDSKATSTVVGTWLDNPRRVAEHSTFQMPLVPYIYHHQEQSAQGWLHSEQHETTREGKH